MAEHYHAFSIRRPILRIREGTAVHHRDSEYAEVRRSNHFAVQVFDLAASHEIE